MLRYLSAAVIVAGIGVTLYFGHGNQPRTQSAPPLRAAPQSQTEPTGPNVVSHPSPRSSVPRRHVRTHRSHTPPVPRAHAKPKIVTSSRSATPKTEVVVYRPTPPAPGQTPPSVAPAPVRPKAPAPKKPAPKKPTPNAPVPPAPPTTTPAPTAPSPQAPVPTPVAPPVVTVPVETPEQPAAPPPPSPPPSLAPATRPGHGYGDTNHVHTGPPGHNK